MPPKSIPVDDAVPLTAVGLKTQLHVSGCGRLNLSTPPYPLDGVIVTDLDARVCFINPMAQELTAWSSDEALGRDVGEVVRYRPAPGARRDARDAAKAEDPVQTVGRVLLHGHAVARRHGQRLIARDGQERSVDESAVPVIDAAGLRQGAVLVLRDASLRVTQEKLLGASEERFRKAFDSAPVGMALISLSGDFLQINDALCGLLGASRDTIQRLNHDTLTPDEEAAAAVERRRSLASGTGGASQFEQRYRRLDSRGPVSVLVSMAVLFSEGQPPGWLVQLHDLTEQKKAAARLLELAAERAQREASELASKAKSDFMSRASHEMRTPLNAVMGFAQLLEMQRHQQHPDPARIALYGGEILRAGAHLLELVDNLLHLRRATQGSAALPLEPVELRPVVDSVCEFLEEAARVQRVTLAVQVPPGVRVMAETGRLRQVFFNLGSNAVKFNQQQGGVRFAVEAAAEGRLCVVVEDDGFGIPPEQMAQLFEPFDRLGREHSATPGVGLGLAVARSLVLEMNGSLRVSSQGGVGTRVVVELAAAPEGQRGPAP